MTRFVAIMTLLGGAAVGFGQGVDGVWSGVATTASGAHVPLHIELKVKGTQVVGTVLNGPERDVSTSGTLVDGHLNVKFAYFAKYLDGEIKGDTFTGKYDGARIDKPIPVTLHKGLVEEKATAEQAAKVEGDWEVNVVKSEKGETAWTLHVYPLERNGVLRAAIQKVDGDTGNLYGGFDAKTGVYTVSHFTSGNVAEYTLKPNADGTLEVGYPLKKDSVWTARRPDEARKLALAGTTDPTQQTTWKDPNAPLKFSYPDLNGKTVSNTDARFQGKVVLVTIGGSWCPNCHDEAPVFEALYRKYRAKGLEIVNLSFEEDGQLQTLTRLHAFVNKYHLEYPVLVAGTLDTVNAAIPGAENLNCWPTTFFVGRDGKVKEIHAGFSGPATGKSHEELVKETDALVEKLLGEKAAVTTASR